MGRKWVCCCIYAQLSISRVPGRAFMESKKPRMPAGAGTARKKRCSVTGTVARSGRSYSPEAYELDAALSCELRSSAISLPLPPRTRCLWLPVAPLLVCGRGGREAVRDLPRYSCSLLARFPDDVAVPFARECCASCELEKRKDLIRGTPDVLGPCEVLGREVIAGEDGQAFES